MRDLTRVVVYFFGSTTFPFFAASVAGAAVTGGGVCSDWASFRQAPAGYWCLAGVFFVYFGGSIWYGCLIYQGRWRTSFWDRVIEALP